MTPHAEQVAREVRTDLEGAGAREWIHAAARAGLASRAVIYALLTVLAGFIVVNGRPPAQASGTGALAEVAKQPAGLFLLGVLSAGLLCYSGWRLAQAAAGVDPASSGRPSSAKRVGWLAIAAMYVLLFAEALSILFGGGASAGPAGHPQGVAATVLSWPAGSFLLVLGGAALAVGGVALAVWGCIHDYGKTLDRDRAPAWVPAVGRVAGVVGNLTRGVLLALVASYTFLAAVDQSPSRVKSLDQSLESVAHSPAGPWWIAILAAGLFGFAVFSVVEALYRRV